jgi:VWFA-related protein
MSYPGNLFPRRATIVASAALLAAAATGSSAQAPQKSPARLPAASAATSVKVNTRLITVDVVANDSHGKPVRDLQQSDFQVFEEHSGEQKIVRFAFVNGSLSGPAQPQHAAAGAPVAPTVFSNIGLPQMRVPPTVILLDALNTEIKNQSEVHRHMLLLLETLPPNTPVAVFTLGHTLHVLQNFTTDSSLLKAAVDHSLRSISIPQNPQDDPNSASNGALNASGGTETPGTQAVEDFEKQEYAEQTSIRVDETTDAMISIAKYLDGYPGRKNLIWVSGSFPMWIEPTSDFGGNPGLGDSPSPSKIPGQEFNASADFSGKIRAAAEALTDAQVAVYPVAATQLETTSLYFVEQDPQINPRNPGASLGRAIARDDNQRIDAQATMKAVAESTGGKTCMNTNDLSGCVEAAIDDGASYYELSYYPQNAKWDGHFQKIVVKALRHGVHLEYRRGYFATDARTRASGAAPGALLQQACNAPLPSTAIGISVEPLAPPQTAGESAGARYLLTISPTTLTLIPPWAAAPGKLSLQIAVCEYDPKGEPFQFFPRDVSQPVTEAGLKAWQQHGLRTIFDYAAKPEDMRLRFAVLDVASGTTGSVDVPAHPTDFGTIPGEPAPAQAAAQRASGAQPASEFSSAVAPLPGAPAPAPAPATVTTALTFRSSSGNSSKLDWSSGTVTYQGDLGVALSASGFFQKFFASQYHCQNGDLISNDPNSTTVPKLALVLRGATGRAVLVDLTGPDAQYTGDLPVDPDARAFFDQVWKLCHCQAP